MSKRKAETLKGIKAAFARAQEVSKSSTKKYPPLEAADIGRQVPDVFKDAVMEHYVKYGGISRAFRSNLVLAAKQRQEACTAGKEATASAPAEQDGLASIDALEAAAESAGRREQLANAAEAWQQHAEAVVKQLSMWPGTQVALPQVLQEQLLHICVNHDIHPNAMLAIQAYQLLQQNLAAHPPVKPAQLQQGEPCILQRNDLCSHPLRKSELDKGNDADTKDVYHPTFKDTFGASNFALLSELVRNAVHLLTGDRNSSCYSDRPADGTQPSRGKGLMLLYVVQLLQADTLVRLTVFEQHMQYAHGLDGDEVQKVRARAAIVLKDGLLHRLLQNDSGWTKSTEDECSRHRLIRDLLAMVATSATDCMVGSNSSKAVASAAAAGFKKAAGGCAHDTLTPAAAAAAAAAAVHPLQPSELVGAARRLLLLLLQLYSSMEATGEYGVGAGAHHAGRGVIGQNDRWWLDKIMLVALSGLQALPALRADTAGPAQAAAALQRILQTLPPVHRVRLIASGVAEAISNRPYDDKNATANNHINALHVYFVDEGKGNAEFRRGDGLQVMKALSERLSWASKEVLGGKEAFAIAIASLISAAVAGKQVPAAELQEFKQVAQQVLSGVAQNSNLQLASCAAQEGSEVVFCVQLAMQQLQV